LTSKPILISGNSNPKLALEIAEYLKIPLGKALISQFSDNESRIEILEDVRGQDLFVIQSTANPTNNSIMELLLITDALKRASAKRITAVIPYFGYARQDKRSYSARVPISARVVADLLATVGINRVVTVDLHSEQIQGFFSIPVDNLYASTILLEDVISKKYKHPIIVSPDVGGVVRARAFAKQLHHAELAIIDKRRPHPNESKVMHIIGEVKDRVCIIVDDLVDTGGTLCHAADALKKHQAKKVVAYCTHPVLSGNAIELIKNSALDELVVTNSIPLSESAKQIKKIRQLSIAPLLAEFMVPPWVPGPTKR
jgi:ribose-phosphate pyrophosphokinase